MLKRILHQVTTIMQFPIMGTLFGERHSVTPVWSDATDDELLHSSLIRKSCVPNIRRLHHNHVKVVLPASLFHHQVFRLDQHQNKERAPEAARTSHYCNVA